MRQPIKEHINNREQLEHAELTAEKEKNIKNAISKILIALLAPLLFILLVILNIKEE